MKIIRPPPPPLQKNKQTTACPRMKMTNGQQTNCCVFSFDLRSQITSTEIYLCQFNINGEISDFLPFFQITHQTHLISILNKDQTYDVDIWQLFSKQIMLQMIIISNRKAKWCFCLGCWYEYIKIFCNMVLILRFLIVLNHRIRRYNLPVFKFQEY